MDFVKYCKQYVKLYILVNRNLSQDIFNTCVLFHQIYPGTIFIQEGALSACNGLMYNKIL